MKKILLILSVCTLSLSLKAQWQPTPITDPCRAIGATAASIYTSTTNYGLLFRSDNNGSAWTYDSSFTVWAISANDSVVFVGSGKGLYKSVKGGNWVSINAGLNSQITSIQSNGNSMLCGSYGKGVFLSGNGGSSWQAVNNGLTNLKVQGVAMNSTAMFACTDGGGMFRSVNNGASWTSINTGLTDPFSKLVIAIAVKGNTIFASTYGGLYMSVDNGDNWTTTATTVDSGPALAVYKNNLYVSNSDIGGIMLSKDNGATFTDISDGLPSVISYQLAFNSSYIFAATSGGVFKRPITEITAVNEIREKIKVNIYPNPSSGNFSVDLPENAQQIIIYDYSGQVIKNEIIENKRDATFSLISNGIYFIKVITSNGSITQKLAVLN